MKFFGLDIGVNTARLVQLNKEKNNLSLVKIGSADLTQPGIRSDTKKQLNSLAQSVKSLVKDLEVSTDNVVFSLPEERVTTRIKWFPPMKEKEVDSALKYEAETFIPHPLEKVELDYQVIDKDDNGRLLVFIVGILKNEVSKYVQIAQASGLNLVALEPESVSLNRILSVKNMSTIIADINFDQTSLSVCQNGNIYLTRSVSIGINSFSRAIKINLGLKENEAESYRKTYGLKGEELEGKIKEAMMPIAEKLTREIKQTVLSFQKDWNQEIGLITLSGRGARTPNLSEVIAKKLGIEVQIAEPFSKIKVPKQLSIDVDKKAVDHSVACGLAARGLL